ncbi:MAG: hypothetical protein KDB83_02185, partial [Actinobacteria bacterium]|nr:hypothetical protein [Actinomycetota bacterium]
MTQTVTPVRDTSGADVARRRLRVLSALILVVGLTIAARLVWLQTAQADTYRAIAQQVQTDVVAVPAARGDIVDRTGQILAGNRTSYEVAVESPVDDQTVAALVDLSGSSKAAIMARMSICGEPGATPGTCYRGEPGRPIPVLTDVPIPQALAIRDADLSGVIVQQVPVRDYPSKANAAHVLGYLGDGQGRSGLEAEYDEALRGQQGEAKQVLTRDGGATEEVIAAPQDGQRLLTTLDLDTQVVAERALRD